MQHSVLVIEDNAVTRKMMRLAMEGEGYNVCEAVDGQAALANVKTYSPSLIVQDLNLPDMDGMDLVARLRATPIAARIPILCYSGLIGEEDRQRVIAAGFTDLVLKPATPSELLNIIRAYLEDTQGAPGPLIGRHILVVDDTPMLLKLTALRVQAAGARVTTAENGNDALMKARADLPDAILSDVLMPECDGFALCQALRYDPHLAAIPIVLLSSQYVDQEDLALAQKLGASALIARSGDLDSALAALTDSLNETAPPPSADAKDLQETHLGRVMYRLHSQINQQARSIQTQTLYAILSGFLDQIADVQTQGDELAAKLDEVLVRYLDACGYPTGGIYLFETDDELALHALSGVANAKADGWLDFFHHAGQLCQALEYKIPTALTRNDPQASALLAAAEAESMLLCPLLVDNQPLGILVLCSKRRQLDPEWLALAQAAARPIAQTIAFARTLTALSASEQRFRGISESLADGVLIMDEESQIIYVNAAIQKMFGHTPESLYGQKVTQLSPLLTTHAGLWSGHATHADGHQIPINGSTAVMLDPEQPHRLSYTHVIHDLSSQAHLEQLRHLANHDALTQVCNRRVFEEQLKNYLSQAKNEDAHGAVLFLDLDFFKQINDRLGHAAGDLVLKESANVMRGVVRQTDVVARLGGDEFAILAPNSQPEQAQVFAGKLLQQLLTHPVVFNDEPIHISVSIGIACYDRETPDPASLLANADQALYQAKQAGRGCYRLHTPEPKQRGRKRG